VWQSAHGFRFCEGSKFAISHWLGWSPLTQCWRYRAACDDTHTRRRRRRTWSTCGRGGFLVITVSIWWSLFIIMTSCQYLSLSMCRIRIYMDYFASSNRLPGTYVICMLAPTFFYIYCRRIREEHMIVEYIAELSSCCRTRIPVLIFAVLCVIVCMFLSSCNN